MNQHVNACIISRYIEVEEIQHKSIGNNEWLVLLKFGKIEKSYEQIEIALLDIDTALCVNETTLFMQLIDDEGATNGIIMLNPSFDPSFTPDTVWRSQPTNTSDEMLVPSLRRLSNQLRVDFASNVHGAEGKRRREPTRSIYEEAAASMKKDMKERMLKRMMKATAKDEVVVMREFGTKKVHQEDANEEDNQTFSAMMHAAKSLAQLKTSLQTVGVQPEQSVTRKLMIETITNAHNETISAKDEIIKAISATLVVKDELIKAQAALISAMQKP
jgi:hypothetical protein